MFLLKAQTAPSFEPLFELGIIKVTESALALMQQHRFLPTNLLARHALGDFGAWRGSPINREGLKGLCEIVSVHVLAPRAAIWILTDPSRSWTLMHTTQEAYALDGFSPEAITALTEQCAEPNAPLEPD